MQLLRNPTFESAKELISQGLRESETIILVGSCIVNYKGRAGSVLPEGERVIMLKPDGTLLVHKKEKREPVNWNPPGCEARVEIGSEGLQIISRRSKPKESILILFKELKLATSFELIDEEELQLVGSESDLVDTVMANPDLIEEGFKPLEREKTTRYGVIDLYGVDAEDNGVVVELKRSKITPPAVWQIGRYINELEKKLEKKIRGILAAPQITSSALELVRKQDLEYVKMEEPPSHSFEKLSFDKSQRKIKEFQNKGKEN
ncbi:MAG: endonuclease NucS [Hadesarchaea archaeon]|nr:endonuclease NucS [Hadesarchaea archaeon]